MGNRIEIAVAASVAPHDNAGALIHYCAGGMLTVTDRRARCFLGSDDRNGDLMVSAVTFGARP